MKKINTGILIAISLSLVSILIGITILVLLYTNNVFRDNPEPASSNENNDIIDTGNYIGSHRVVDRIQWGGRPPLSSKPIRSPVPLVIIKHTGGGTCTSLPTCAGKMQSLISNSMARGHSDITHSFVIGGDGNIYVGRGWDVEIDQISVAIDIAFMGSFTFDILTEPMIEAAQLLLEKGVEQHKLADDYKLVAHNQTMSTESPGRNVYNEIIKWPHYDGRIEYGKLLLWRN